MAPPGVRTFDHRQYPPGHLVELKGDRSVSVCLPARDEATTIGAIVTSVRSTLAGDIPLVDEILVVDDGSVDGTARAARSAGATVVEAGSVLAAEDVGQGKGQAMWKAVAEAEGELIVFCDADVTNFGPHFVTGLLGPLLSHDGVAMVKGLYDRPFHDQPAEGGRVTELMARPLIASLFPHLSGIAQPLAGECAGRREVFEQLPFAHGYGVELGLLIDVAAGFGAGALAQVDLGLRVHRNRPLAELAPQALAVLQVALARGGIGGGVAGGVVGVVGGVAGGVAGAPSWAPGVGRGLLGAWSVSGGPIGAGSVGAGPVSGRSVGGGPWRGAPPATLVRPGVEPTLVRPGWCPPLVEIAGYRRRSA